MRDLENVESGWWCFDFHSTDQNEGEGEYVDCYGAVLEVLIEAKWTRHTTAEDAVVDSWSWITTWMWVMDNCHVSLMPMYY